MMLKKRTLIGSQRQPKAESGRNIVLEVVEDNGSSGVSKEIAGFRFWLEVLKFSLAAQTSFCDSECLLQGSMCSEFLGTLQDQACPNYDSHANHQNHNEA